MLHDWPIHDLFAHNIPDGLSYIHTNNYELFFQEEFSGHVHILSTLLTENLK